MWVFFLFVFHVLQFILIRFTQQNLCCISNSMMRFIQKQMDWKPNLPLFTYDYRKCMFADLLIVYIVLPTMFTIECIVVVVTWRRSNLIQACVFYKLCSRSSPNHIPIKHKGPIKKTSHLRSLSLSLSLDVAFKI